MTGSLAAFQSGVGRALRGEGQCPIDQNSAGFLFMAKVRRSWCEGRASIAARAVLTLVPELERRRLIASYVDRGGGLRRFLPTENAAFLAFLTTRLPDPSHALSLCRMDQALALARAGAATFVPPGEDVAGEGMAGEDVAGARVERGRYASLVWFHADPGAVSRALNGGPLPPVGAPHHAVLFAPGLPNLYRVATAEEAAMWTRPPATNGACGMVERLVAEGVLALRE